MTRLHVKKALRIGLWGTCSIFILATGLLIFLNIYLPTIIKTKIYHLVIDGSDSLYKCSIGNVSINFWLSKAVIEDINITVDSARYKQLKLKDSIPGTTFELKITKASIRDLNILQFLFSKKIFIAAIHLEKTDLNFCLHSQKDRRPPKTKKPLWQMIEPFTKGLYINKITLDNIKFLYSPLEDRKSQSFSYEDGFISLHNIRIDSVGAASRSRIQYTENISVNLIGIKYYTPDSLYYLKIDTFSYSSIRKNLLLKQFVLKPTLSIIEFTAKKRMQTDIFEIVLPEVNGTNFKMERIFINNEICFDTIIFKSPVLKINRDRTAHHDTTSQLGKYPNEALQKAPITIRIPLVLIQDAELHYIERQKLSLKTADAYFTDINGFISNITNNKIDLQQNGHCNLHLTGLFLKQGKLKIQMDFDLASVLGHYRASADLGPMTSHKLNTVFIPFANLRLKTFTFNGGHIQITGNKEGIRGSTKLLYQHLSIEILYVNEKTHQTKNKGFASFLANLIAVRTNNIPGKKEVIANNIYVHRKTLQPFGNLMWEFVFESLKKIILKIPAKDLKVEM